MKNMLKEMRESLGLTQEDLAKKAKTSYQQIYKLENGERKLSSAWIYRLCKALNCQPHHLIPEFLELYTPRQREIIDELDEIAIKERAVIKKMKEEKANRLS